MQRFARCWHHPVFSSNGLPPDDVLHALRGTAQTMSPDASTPDAVSKDEAETGPMGQRFLAGTDTLAMRLWDNQQPGEAEPSVARDYETVGYVVSGRVELTVGTTVLDLGPGDSWSVPRGAEHSYRVVEVLTAVEATSPPAQAQR